MLVAAAVLALLVPSSGGARVAAAGAWQVVGVGGTERPVGLIGLSRLQGTLHVAWVRRTGGNSYDLMQTPISPTGNVGQPIPIVTGWAGLGDVALVQGAGGLLAFFDGERTTTTGEPYFGLNLATSESGGASWQLYGPGSIYTQEFAYGRAPSATGVGQTIQTWNGRSGQIVHVGLDPNSAVSVYGPSACCLLGQNIVSDGSQAWVAWCAQNDAPGGRWVQQIDPASGRPEGSAQKLPSSEGPLCESSGREPLVARPGGGFYVADVGGGSDKHVLLWKIGGGAPLTAASSSDSHSRVALAAAPDGRLWVAWRTFHGASTIHLRRSNKAATRFGAEVQVPAPKGAVEVSHIDLDAQTDRVDVLASFSFVSPSQNTLYHVQAFPGLTLNAHGGKRSATFAVTDAGDPVAGATIKVGGRTVRTDARGNATVKLAAGSYRAVATKEHYVAAAAGLRVAAGR